jgi:hypothetical protein
LESNERSLYDNYFQREDESGEERQQRLREAAEKVDAERLALLGAERFEAYKDFLYSAPTRQAVNQLRLDLVDAGLPLHADQVDALVADLTDERRRHQTEREALWSAQRARPSPSEIANFSKQKSQLIEDHLDRAHDIASAHLTSDQLEVFDRMLERQRKWARAEAAESKAYAKVQGGG